MKNFIIGAIVGALVVAGVALVVGKQSVQLSAEGDTNLTNLVLEGDLTVGDAVTVTGIPTFTADAVFNGGDGGIVVTTSNTATSSIEVGCIQMYATSTATSWRAYASSTATIEGVDGVMLMEYGTCPKI